jgi:RNA polymerase sigma-70 factor (ECF subfamily)
MSSDATTYTIQGLLGASSTDGADDSARQSCGDGIANKSGEKSDPSAARPTDVHTVENLADELLFKQVQEGDSAALGILFRRYARMVRTVAQRILRDASEADDLLQEVFLFAFRKAALFNSARGSGDLSPRH